MRLAPIIFLAALVSACASAPLYAPALKPNGAGYSHMQIEANRFFVTYRAPGGADPRMIEDFALLRAADLTLEQGHSWFIVDRRSTDTSEAHDSGPRVGVSVGGASWGHHSSSGVGVGVSFPIGGGGPKANSATLEIRMGDGTKPDDPNAYDALPVSMSLRRQIQAGS